jgi:hypothetical protein
MTCSQSPKKIMFTPQLRNSGCIENATVSLVGLREREASRKVTRTPTQNEAVKFYKVG